MRPLMLSLAILTYASTALTAQSRTAVLAMSADIGPRVALKVSRTTLQFSVENRGPVLPQSAIDFTASARTRNGGEVILAVEPLTGLTDADGASCGGGDVEIVGVGSSRSGARLDGMGPRVVAQWQGSGRRAGRVVFQLHGESPTRACMMSVRLVLTTP